ncbi:MAG: cyclase family protein [Bacillati bacterium ANGP1]|uniref:Cyclase family protein n=1 Tax=Candidatus Segetimicrobium genomatis TaxID=2569760 RepID=A0A537IFE6_9BACT|nr:MAG: cyclase family protein [Terrabacteria group bacterium ANGP1]
MIADGEVGPGATVPPEKIRGAAALVRDGRVYSLAAPRFPGMPLFAGHPKFEVLTYRSPRGIRAAGDQPWGPHNEAGLGYMSEVIMGTAHSGAHIDALAHMTIGPEGRWYGGGNADEHLGDFGPRFGDAEKLPPLFTRGVLLDVAAWRGLSCLQKGEAVSAQDLETIAHVQGTPVGESDVVLIRTGYMSLWPDAERMAAHATPGPDVSAARWLSARRIAATGSDTETYEVQPAPDPGEPSNPQPVHTHLLIECGIYIMESLDLEAISRDRVYEFLFVACPLKIRGATGSMIDPLAVV